MSNSNYTPSFEDQKTTCEVVNTFSAEDSKAEKAKLAENAMQVDPKTPEIDVHL